MTRDDLIDKEVAEKLSKEVVSYIIEQVTKDERNQNQNLRLAKLLKKLSNSYEKVQNNTN